MTPILGIDIGGGSVKSAGVLGNQTVWTGQSSHYSGKPTRATLVKAIAEAVGKHEHRFDVVGLCVPGMLDEKKERVLRKGMVMPDPRDVAAKARSWFHKP